MQMDLFTMLFVIGTSFSLIAAVMAFLISYEEYRKHFIDRRKTLAMSAVGSRNHGLFCCRHTDYRLRFQQPTVFSY